MKFIIFFILLSFTTTAPPVVLAQEFATIVNPVRISSYTKDPGESLNSQYSQVSKRNLPATWLLTYDVLTNPNSLSVISVMNDLQEIGIFLEVTPKFATEAGVVYNKTDSWHRASSVFLSGYLQPDRIKLIDKIFEQFKKTFGHYPKSVGAWWVDSYSLEYMQKKYGISGNLTVADQFSTDGYQVWGQYWSTPFYPSKYHAGIPARTAAAKLDLVTIQWAARDPLNGYGRSTESTFSTQDYMQEDYFEKLVDLYTQKSGNKFGHITVGLEGDFTPETYGGYFSRQLEIIKRKQNEGQIKILTMVDFSQWYKESFPNLSPAQIIQTDDLLGKKIKSFWYQSPSFRLNLTYDLESKQTFINDFRVYSEDFEEPYYVSPNKDLNLSVNVPSIIDSASNPQERWLVFNEELENVSLDNGKLILKYPQARLELEESRIRVTGNIGSVPKQVAKSPFLDVTKKTIFLELVPKTKWVYPREGLVFRGLTQEATFFLKQRKIIALTAVTGLVLLLTTFVILRSRFSLGFKFLLIVLWAILLGGGYYKFYLPNTKLYFVNQSELDALFRLKLMDGKKIVVYDRVCLQCSWHTTYMPAVFANKRDYVKKITGKTIVYNSSVFNAKSREEGKKDLAGLNADYIYVVRYGDYREIVPFSPGDLNIEEIYANANAQIWRIKKN